MNKRHAFTLIELLVVIAIIALLLSILVPALKKVKSQAKRVVCSSRLKQTGIGLRMYAGSNNGRLPDDHDFSGDNRELHTYAAYRKDAGYYDAVRDIFKPLRFAYLYELNYIDEPKIFYCPGNRLDGYKYESYVNPAPWGTTADQEYNLSTGSNHWVRVGYSYYPVQSGARLDPDTQAPEELALKYDLLKPNFPIATDVIHNRKSISHQSNKRYTLNVLFSDSHVSACNDQSIFKDLIDPFGGNVWDTLDDGVSSFTWYYDTAIYTVFRAIRP